MAWHRGSSVLRLPSLPAPPHAAAHRVAARAGRCTRQDVRPHTHSLLTRSPRWEEPSSVACDGAAAAAAQAAFGAGLARQRPGRGRVASAPAARPAGPSRYKENRPHYITPDPSALRPETSLRRRCGAVPGGGSGGRSVAVGPARGAGARDPPITAAGPRAPRTDPSRVASRASRARDTSRLVDSRRSAQIDPYASEPCLTAKQEQKTVSEI